MASRPIELTLYRRPQCGLCNEAEAMLDRLARRIALHVVSVDIDADPALQERYFLEIPVIVCDGEEIARAPISERALESSLRALVGTR